MALAPLAAQADDPWELDIDDDNAGTRAHILAGQTQAGRDVQGGPVVPDQDWLYIAPLARHSYEARAVGGPFWMDLSLTNAARLDRVNGAGTVLTAGTSADVVQFRGHTVRWIEGPTSTVAYLRVIGPPTATMNASPYVLEFFDTTYAIPRWNNSATQSTIFLIQNNKPAAVAGSIFFYNGGGTLLHTEPLSVPANGLQVLNTGLIAQLAGLNGSATVAHTGGRGALSGKAVALEPATGFTFDTAMAPVMP